MAINTNIKRLMLTALFLYGLFSVQAQTASYFLDPDSAEPRFIQRLSWSGGMYARHCEVIIEKEEGGGYVNYFRQFTTNNYFDISLPHGNYRFRVIPYDILDKPSTGTQWAQFTVFSAIKPEIYKPEDELDYYNDRQGSKFEFTGKNIEPEAEVYFVNSGGKRIDPVEIIISDDGNSVRVAFDKGQLVDGEYDVFIVNPGGLETSLGDIEYRTYKEKFGELHYTAGISFMPAFHLYGEELNSDGSLYYLSARVGINACIVSNKYFGVEFSLSKFWNNDNYINSAENGYIFGYNFIFINWLPERVGAVNFKIGVGFDMQLMTVNNSTVGVFFLYNVLKYLNIEAGVDYIHTFSDNSGNILPWIGICMIF